LTHKHELRHTTVCDNIVGKLRRLKRRTHQHVRLAASGKCHFATRQTPAIDIRRHIDRCAASRGGGIRRYGIAAHIALGTSSAHQRGHARCGYGGEGYGT